MKQSAQRKLSEIIEIKERSSNLGEEVQSQFHEVTSLWFPPHFVLQKLPP